jgi:hypothetical protein
MLINIWSEFFDKSKRGKALLVFSKDRSIKAGQLGTISTPWQRLDLNLCTTFGSCFTGGQTQANKSHVIEKASSAKASGS